MRIGKGSMSSINENAIEDLSIWAKENEDKSIFSEIIKEKTSYYKNRDINEDYMMEYSFQDITELKSVLKRYSGLETDLWILQKLVMIMCQDRYIYKTEEKRKQKICESDIKNIKRQEMLIDIKSMETFSEWAGGEDKDVFPKIDEAVTSYYIDRLLEETYIMEYTISNMEELKSTLDAYIKLPSGLTLSNKVIVEICRKRCTNELKMDKKENSYQQKEIADKGKKILPEHIYVF